MATTNKVLHDIIGDTQSSKVQMVTNELQNRSLPSKEYGDDMSALQMTVVSSTTCGEPVNTVKTLNRELTGYSSPSSDVWFTSNNTDIDSITAPLIENSLDIIDSTVSNIDTRISIMQSSSLNANSIPSSKEKTEEIRPILDILPFYEQIDIGSDLEKFQNLFISDKSNTSVVVNVAGEKTSQIFKDRIFSITSDILDNAADSTNEQFPPSPKEAFKQESRHFEDEILHSNLETYRSFDAHYFLKSVLVHTAKNEVKLEPSKMSSSSKQNQISTEHPGHPLNLLDYTHDALSEQIHGYKNFTDTHKDISANITDCGSYVSESIAPRYSASVSGDPDASSFAKSKLRSSRKKTSLRTLNYLFRSFGLKKISPKVINTTKSFTERTVPKKKWWDKLLNPKGNSDNGIITIGGLANNASSTGKDSSLYNTANDNWSNNGNVTSVLDYFPERVYTLNRVTANTHSKSDVGFRTNVSEHTLTSRLRSTLNLNFTMSKVSSRTLLRHKRGKRIAQNPSYPTVSGVKDGGQKNYNNSTELYSPNTLSTTVDVEMNNFDHAMPRLVPVVVLECAKHIVSNGLRTKGLFRVNGSGARISNLIKRFEQSPKYGLGESFDGYTVYDVADCLKRYLRCMPACILTRELSPEFIKCLKIPEYQNLRVMAIQLLFFLLPISHLQLLEHILALFSKIIENTEYNNMNSRSLARIFSPSFLHLKGSRDSIDDYKKSSEIMEYIINNRDDFSFCSSYTQSFTGSVGKEIENILKADHEIVKPKNISFKPRITYLTAKRFHKKKPPFLKMDIIHSRCNSINSSTDTEKLPLTYTTNYSSESKTSLLPPIVSYQEVPPQRLDSNNAANQPKFRSKTVTRGLSANELSRYKIIDDELVLTQSPYSHARLFRRVNTNPGSFRYKSNNEPFFSLRSRAPAVF